MEHQRLKELRRLKRGRLSGATKAWCPRAEASNRSSVRQRHWEPTKLRAASESGSRWNEIGRAKRHMLILYIPLTEKQSIDHVIVVVVVVVVDDDDDDDDDA